MTSNSSTISNSTTTPMWDQWLVGVAFGLASLEFALHPVALCISALNVLVLWSSRFLHPNLRFFLICQSVGIAAFELGRWAVIWQKFIGQDIFRPAFVGLQIEARACVFFRSSIPHAIMLERFVATIFFRKYEQSQRLYISIFCCLIFVSLSLINGFSSTDSWSTSLITYLAQLISILLSLLEILVFGWIKIINQKKYDRILSTASTGHNDYSLSEKYQLSENIRTSRQLLPAFMCHVFNNSLTTLVYVIGYYKLLVVDSPREYSIFFAAFLSMESALNAGIEVTVISHHPLLKKKFLTLVRQMMFWRHVRVHIERTVVDNNTSLAGKKQPRDIRGCPLVVELDMELYFRMLDAEWR